VFHANYYGPWVGAPPLVLSVPDLIYLDFPEFAPRGRRRSMKVLGRLSARVARVVVAGSEYSRGRVLKHYGLPEDRVVVVHYGLGDEWHRPDETAIARAWSGLRERVPARYLITVGRLDTRKNFPACARVARALAQEGLLDGLVIVGPADFGAGAIERALDRDGTRQLVTRLAGLSLVEIQALYRNALGLVYLSLAEGFGLPLIEAMALGTPVVSSNRTAMPEVCGGAALLVDPDDVREATEAARRMITDPATRDGLVRAGSARAAAFRSAAMADAMAAVYGRAAGRRD
jgi:glycosyltransferase involved in cell wall biosynthesis